MSNKFDYIIVGGGLSGLQLALEFNNDIFFEDKKIGIIDPSLKTTNDKTWCFWEKGKGKWDSIIHKSWESGKFISSSTNLELKLDPYRYKMLRAIDFYNFAKDKLQSNANIEFIKDEIIQIDNETCIATGKNNTYQASHFFDSRITSDYKNTSEFTNIYQHFKGWMIETENDSFDDSKFTMMDFRIKHENSTSFTYFLPVSKNKALVEFTFFTPFLTDDSTYDIYLKRYISEILKIENYVISEVESGVIPMTDFPFHKSSTSNITKIGTAGSWVKGSTGYSFKHSEKKSAQIISNLKLNIHPNTQLLNRRFRFYDAIFLDVLNERNDMGEEIFTKFYSKNTPQHLLKYLDEETMVPEDIEIMISLYHTQFLKSFFKKLF